MGMYVVRLNSDTNNPLNKILFFRTNDEHIGDVLLSTNVVYGRNGLTQTEITNLYTVLVVYINTINIQ